TQFYYKFGDTKIGKNYIEKNYDNWFDKALIMSKVMPNRGDLIMPFLSYAITENKSKDAAKICAQPLEGIEGMCDLFSSYQILNKSVIDKKDIKQSIKFINSAIAKGIFDELVFGYAKNSNFENQG